MKTYCESKYYAEYNSEQLFQDTKKHIEPTLTNLSKEFQSVFYKMLTDDPCIYWNKVIYKQTYGLLEALFQDYGNQLEINETIFNYFLMGYNSYCQLADAVLDFRNFNLTQETKTRLYRLPTFTALLESCLSNF